MDGTVQLVPKWSCLAWRLKTSLVVSCRFVDISICLHERAKASFFCQTCSVVGCGADCEVVHGIHVAVEGG